MVCLILLALLKAQTDTVLYNTKDMLNKVSTYKGGLFLERFSKKPCQINIMDFSKYREEVQDGNFGILGFSAHFLEDRAKVKHILRLSHF